MILKAKFKGWDENLIFEGLIPKDDDRYVVGEDYYIIVVDMGYFDGGSSVIQANVISKTGSVDTRLPLGSLAVLLNLFELTV